ncbi:EamA family transporter [Natranaerofaba carboxydovora]|uniref:EamA family transporter n=1 Tax=Natranaerofaba carboxydovora TaxID=2742683 RepID=UPI003B847F3B
MRNRLLWQSFSRCGNRQCCFINHSCYIFIFVKKINIRFGYTLSPKTISWAYVKVGVWSSLALYTIFAALNLAPVSIVNSLASMEPLGAIIFSAVMLKKHDIITPRLLIGGLVVMAGSVLIFLF